MIPPLILPPFSGPPKNAGPGFVFAYGVIYCVFCFVMAGMAGYFFLDWRQHFGEWKWHLLVFSGLFGAFGTGLAVLLWKIWFSASGAKDES